MTKSSLELRREQDAIRRELLSLKKAKDRSKVVPRAKDLRRQYDAKTKSIERAEAAERTAREQQRRVEIERRDRREFPVAVSAKEQQEYQQLETDPGGVTAEWRGARLRVNRGCTICGYHLVKPASGRVGYPALRASGFLCKPCESRMAQREAGDLLNVLALVTTDRLRRERLDLVPDLAHDEYVDGWEKLTWAGRLREVDREMVGQQQPMQQAFGFLAPPIQTSSDDGNPPEEP